LDLPAPYLPPLPPLPPFPATAYKTEWYQINVLRWSENDKKRIENKAT
jgi:hypothetical protein